jgi:hypothetical protein
MLMKKNALISIAMVLALAACGGGSDGGDPPQTTNPPAGGNPPPGGDNPPSNVDDTVMEGHLMLVGDQVLFNGIGITLEQFANGAYGFAKGTYFPLETFGLRLMPTEMTVPDGQSQRARVAVELVDSAADGQQAAQMMIDEVDMEVDAAGAWTVSIPPTATLYVFARDAAGQTANIAVTNLPADLINLTAIDGDSTSNGFTIDLDRAFEQVVAGAPAEDQAVFNSVIGFTGDFNMRTTVSNVEIRSQSGDAPLTGASITVTGSGQPAVTGAGVQGVLQVE